MNFKIFIRLVVLLIATFILVGGVVAGGVALSYRIVSQHNKDTPIEPDIQQLENVKEDKKEIKLLNVLLLGVDKDGYRTDVNILAQYNFKTKKVNMLQIPRDTKIETKRYDKKINSAYAFGKEEELFKAVKNLLGVDVDKYVLVNIQGFRNLIDEIGGVKMNVPIRMLYDDPVQNLHINLQKGEQVLDGRKAEMFVRFRQNNDGTGYPDGDVGRVKAQQEFLNAAIDQVFNVKNIFKLPKLVTIIVKNIKTNFEVKEIVQYIDEALKIDRSNINMMLLPGQSSYIGGISYYIHDKEETEKIIQQYFMGNEESIEEESLGNNKWENEGLSQPQTNWKKSSIKVEVLNASNVDGAATQIGEILKQKGFELVKIENFSGITYSKTKVINRTNKGYAKEVAQVLGEADITEDIDKDSTVDVTVIVGNDI